MFPLAPILYNLIGRYTVNSPMIKNVDSVALAGLPIFSQCSWCLPVGI